ncbi:MAG: PAS domain S-box protein [Breznakibacter sp.]|nr:PAS domain S-box protein [Breznakibacter sp.]
MKKIKTKRIIKLYTLRGLILGLIVSLLTLLLGMNSDVFHNSDRTLGSLFYIFPGLWLIFAFPIITALGGYWLAKNLSLIIRKQNRSLQDEGSRSQHILTFVDSLGEGRFNDELVIKNQNDHLGLSLKRLRDYMIRNKQEEEQRRIEEEQRTWVTNGLAQFAEILRRNNDNMEELSFNIIQYLVNYMKINQGGFFLLNSNNKGDKYFELSAFIAYDRKKFADKIIPYGEGLIGRCGLERETIYMTDIPDNYMNVTSGLGESNPRSLLIVPLKANDEIFGVIEMASFQPFHEYEIGFVEKIAESIALTISTVRTNIQTAKLLRETQIQAEKMSQQEEELRQNLEEMQATQEESERREVERKGILDAIDHAAISCEFETDGTLISVNHNFLKTFKYKPEEIDGQNLKIFFFKDDVDELESILLTLQSGSNYRGRCRRRTKTGEEIFLLSTYSPVIDNEGDILKIISLETDVTDQVRLEEEMKRSKEELGVLLEEARNEMKEQFKEIEAVKIRNEKTLEGALDAIITTNKDGVIEFFNAAAEKLWGYRRNEVLGNQVNMLFSAETIKSNDFVKAFATPDMKKVVGERREVAIKDKFGEEVAVLFLLSEAQVGEDHSFTAFIQNVEVELF